MKLEIKHQVTSIDLDPVSVVLSHDADQPDAVKMAHCMRCGQPLIQHVGRIVAVYPGFAPLSLPLILKCRRCEESYAFYTVTT